MYSNKNDKNNKKRNILMALFVFKYVGINGIILMFE